MDRDLYFERYAVSSWLNEDCSLEESLVKIAGAGFNKVEIWADLIHLDPRANPDIKAIKALLSKLNLKAHSVHLPYNNLELGYPDWSLMDAWLDIFGITLEYCDQLNSRIAVVHADGPVDPELAKESAKISKAFVKELGAMAGKYGIRLAVENMVRSKRRQFGCSLVELAEEFPDPALGFCLDTGHSALNRSDIGQEIRAAGKRLITIHADNNDGVTDLHQVPTDGVLDWQRVLESLDEGGYENCLVLEISGEKEGPDVILERLRNLWKDI